MKNSKMVISLKKIYLIFFIFFFNLYRAIFDSNLNFNLDFIVLFLSALSGGLYLSSIRRVRSRILMILIPFIILVAIVFEKFNFSDARLIMFLLAGLVFANEDEIDVIKITMISKIILVLAILLLFGGFAQRNGVGANIGTILLLYVCLSKDKLELKKWLLIFAGVLLLWFINPENAGALVILLMTLAFQLLRKFAFGKKILCSRMIQFVLPVCLFFTWFFSESINVNRMPLVGRILPSSINLSFLKFVRSLNLLVGTRLSLSKTALDRIGVHIIGADYYFAGYRDLVQDAFSRKGYFVVDSGYILLLVKWGVLVTAIICILSVIIMKYYISIRAYNYVIVGIAFATWAILEDQIFYSFIWMFWGKALIEMWNTKKRRNIINE